MANNANGERSPEVKEAIKLLKARKVPGSVDQWPDDCVMDLIRDIDREATLSRQVATARQ